MSEFTKVATLGEIPHEGAKEVEFAGRVVAIFRDGADYLAIDSTCPHMGGPLAGGTVRDGAVSCPWHGWRFDLRTGCNVVSKKMVQPTYDVRISGDDVLLAARA